MRVGARPGTHPTTILSFVVVFVGLVRTRFDPRRLRWVNWLSGAIIVGFGLVALTG